MILVPLSKLPHFFDLPAQKQEFERAVSAIQAFGGADPSESGLEALFLAIRSAWRNEPRNFKRRQVIVLFSDNDAHEIGGAEIPLKFAQHPHPKSFTDLKFLWERHDNQGSMNKHGKRLIMFAPDKVSNSLRMLLRRVMIHGETQSGLLFFSNGKIVGSCLIHRLDYPILIGTSFFQS